MPYLQSLPISIDHEAVECVNLSDMDHSEHDLDHPKKRRRREVERRPLAARLVFDDHVKGDAALLSESLWAKLELLGGMKWSTHSEVFHPC